MAKSGTNHIGRAAAVGIVALRERWHTKNHPFYTDFHQGKFGLEPLGRLYLAFLFLTLFQLAPNLIQQVFLPNIVKHRKVRDMAAVSRELRHLLAITVAYSFAAIIALWLLAEPLLGLSEVTLG